MENSKKIHLGYIMENLDYDHPQCLKGKSTVTVAEYVKTFKVGDKVVIIPKAKPAGMPHLRYANRHGVIIEQRGKSYVVEVPDMGSTICR
jgi:ribosomal protein L21E